MVVAVLVHVLVRLEPCPSVAVVGCARRLGVRALARRVPPPAVSHPPFQGISIVLNIAEGAGRRGAADRARFFAIARGSATECAAILDIVRASGLAAATVTWRGRDLLVRIVQMLTRLCQRLEAASRCD